MIYINGRFLTQQMTGVHRYAFEICKALKKLGTQFVILMPSKEVNDCYDVSDLNVVKWGFGSGHIWEQFELPFFFLFKKKRMLINFTGLGPVMMFDKIITIHDLAFRENPSWYSKQYVMLYKLLMPISAATSKKILTVSEFSKKEIIKYLGVDRGKIFVTYNSTSQKEVTEKNLKGRCHNGYVLAVSSIDPRKNFDRLITAFSKISESQLFVVGGENPVFSSVKLSYPSKNVIFMGRLSDEELIVLYKHATAFVYPSVYEGFGIPPIEAMSYGCPVAVSDIDVFHEVCGDAALYFNPYSVEDIEDKIRLMLSDDKLRKELVEKGYMNIARFSWEESAKKVLKVINEIT